MRTRRGFSITDLLIIIAVLAILVALLLPALNTVRESARRSTCIANHKQLALAIKTYEEQRRTYPPSAYTIHPTEGREAYVEGKISSLVPGSTEGDTPAPFT